ncbi:MAG: orange carotenoid protein N-terminal domain-containing protein [Synechococcales bacterium]|nr:orange carotenoid protein N-terminal domain-containing protein [Synechococcales bacterium]
MTFSSLRTNPNQSSELFRQQSADDQLALLWYLYTKIGKTVTPAAPDAASPQIMEGLFNQFKALSHQEQLQAMRDVATCQSTQLSREYGSLSAETKLGFWYRLAQGMDNGTIVPMPEDYQMAEDANQLLAAVESMEFEQQITFLRNAVNPMGAEPKAGAEI